MSHHSSFLPFFVYCITKDFGQPRQNRSQKLFLCYHERLHANTSFAGSSIVLKFPCVNYSGVMDFTGAAEEIAVNANMIITGDQAADIICEVAAVPRSVHSFSTLIPCKTLPDTKATDI